MEILERKLDRTYTKKSYKKVVWFYDLWSLLTESKAAKKVIDFADIKNSEHILEVACGTGVVLNKLLAGTQMARILE